MRHVWARVPGTRARHPLEAPKPALVLHWRQHAGQWEALIVYVDDHDDQEPITLQAWVPATALRPVRSDPNLLWGLR